MFRRALVSIPLLALAPLAAAQDQPTDPPPTEPAPATPDEATPDEATPDEATPPEELEGVAAEAATLRPGWTVGQTFARWCRQELDMELEGAMAAPQGDTVELELDLEYLLRFEVAAVPEGGGVSLEATIARVRVGTRLSGAGPKGEVQEESFDSADPADAAGAADVDADFRPFYGMIDQTMGLGVGPDGALEQVTGLDAILDAMVAKLPKRRRDMARKQMEAMVGAESFAALTAGLFPGAPEGELEAGAEWTDAEPLHAPGLVGLGPGLEGLEADVRYVYLGTTEHRGEPCAKLLRWTSFEGADDVAAGQQLPGAETKAALAPFRTRSRLFVRLADGLVLEAEPTTTELTSTTTMRLKGKKAGPNMPKAMTMTSVVHVSRSLAPVEPADAAASGDEEPPATADPAEAEDAEEGPAEGEDAEEAPADPPGAGD